MAENARRDEIYFDGVYLLAFLDGRGFAFDDDGNEYQRRNKKWIRIRRPFMACCSLSKSKGKLKVPIVGHILGVNKKLKT
jgi:hypothetical protein